MASPRGAQPRQAVPAPAGGEPDGNFLHSNPFPNTPDGPGGRVDECETGNEPWLMNRKVIGNVPGNQGNKTETTKITRDSEGSLPSQAIPPEQAGAEGD